MRGLLLATFLILVIGCAAPAVKPPTEQRPGVPPKIKVSVGEVSLPPASVVTASKDDTFDTLAQRYLGDASLGWYVAQYNGLEALSHGQVLVIPASAQFTGGAGPDGFQAVPVLCYHKFSTDKSDKMTVTKKDFEAQMQFLKDNGYTVITLERLDDFLDRKTLLPPKSLVITVDDGWRSFYEIAYPIIKKFGYPVTLFVYTDLVTGSSKTVSWDMLKELAANGVAIHNHSTTHRDISDAEKTLGPKEFLDVVRSEVKDSEALLIKKAAARSAFFAYPYGASTPLLRAYLARNGYRGAFSVEREGNPFFADKLNSGRIMVFGDFDLERFKLELEEGSLYRVAMQ